MDDSQHADVTRKSPVQTRARKTIETILDATAQLLAEEGGERLTTNRLARKAGFSIGTIYQYFSSREAIVLALIARQREEVESRVKALLESRDEMSAEDKIRAIVHILHEAFNRHRRPERRLTLALLRLATTQGLPTPHNFAVEAIVEIWMKADPAGDRRLNESEVFVLSRSVIEVLRQATLYGSPLLGTTEFEDAILRLVFGFLRAQTGPV